MFGVQQSGSHCRAMTVSFSQFLIMLIDYSFLQNSPKLIIFPDYHGIFSRFWCFWNSLNQHYNLAKSITPGINSFWSWFFSKINKDFHYLYYKNIISVYYNRQMIQLYFLVFPVEISLMSSKYTVSKSVSQYTDRYTDRLSLPKSQVLLYLNFQNFEVFCHICRIEMLLPCQKK